MLFEPLLFYFEMMKMVKQFPSSWEEAWSNQL